MSVINLTNEGEFRYIIQWFNEWSELQREDFIPILLEYLKSDGVYVNGIVSGLSRSSCNDKPMSLFQCRIKLFREWSIKWPEDFKIRLKEKIIEIDSKFTEQITLELEAPTTNGVGGLNGYENGIHEEEHELNTPDEPAPIVIINEDVAPLVQLAQG